MAAITPTTSIETINILNALSALDDDDLFFIQRGNSGYKFKYSNLTLNSDKVLVDSNSPLVGGTLSEVLYDFAVDIGNNDNDISALSSDVGDNTYNISVLSPIVSLHTSNIAALSSDVSSLQISVATNTSDISNLTPIVNNNTTNITSNSSSISNLVSRVTVTETDSVNNKNSIKHVIQENGLTYSASTSSQLYEALLSMLSPYTNRKAIFEERHDTNRPITVNSTFSTNQLNTQVYNNMTDYVTLDTSSYIMTFQAGTYHIKGSFVSVEGGIHVVQLTLSDNSGTATQYLNIANKPAISNSAPNDASGDDSFNMTFNQVINIPTPTSLKFMQRTSGYGGTNYKAYDNDVTWTNYNGGSYSYIGCTVEITKLPD